MKISKSVQYIISHNKRVSMPSDLDIIRLVSIPPEKTIAIKVFDTNGNSSWFIFDKNEEFIEELPTIDQVLDKYKESL